MNDVNILPDVVSDKVYNTMMNVGKAKYVVNYHDGVEKHKDGSPFFNIAIFHNKRFEANFIKQLQRDGYNGC